MTTQHNCIICEKNLEAVLESKDDSSFTPNDATIWTSTGNYGSTVYDEMGAGNYIRTFICDECLKAKQKFVQKVTIECKRNYLVKPVDFS